MTFVTGLECVICGAAAPAPASAGTCSSCGHSMAMLQVRYDLEAVGRSMTADALAARPFTMWRYRELLPVDADDEALAEPVGGTPLLDAPRLAAWAGCRGLRLKDEGRNPTASFKDRASFLAVAHARQGGATHLACASTGNAASSLAGACARAGIEATIFVPRRAPDAKVAQLLVFGADVKRVRGSYAQAYDLSAEECVAQGWYSRNCAVNPYLVEGKKTCGLELAEQTRERAADWVVVSVGDGCTIAAIVQGLEEMHALGFLARVPRVLGVQASGVAPIAHAFEHGALPEASDGATMADSIDVAVPRNWRKAVAAVRRTDGCFVTVDDEAIGAAMRATGAHGGVFAEPAAAAAVAGVRRAVLDHLIDPADDVVAVITGSGLKDVQGALRVAGAPTEVDPLR